MRLYTVVRYRYTIPDRKVNGANMGPTWVLPAPDGPHVGPMNPAIRDALFIRCGHRRYLSLWRVNDGGDTEWKNHCILVTNDCVVNVVDILRLKREYDTLAMTIFLHEEFCILIQIILNCDNRSMSVEEDRLASKSGSLTYLCVAKPHCIKNIKNDIKRNNHFSAI